MVYHQFLPRFFYHRNRWHASESADYCEGRGLSKEFMHDLKQLGKLKRGAVGANEYN